MIIEHTKQDLSNILNVINDAAIKYKGVIPNDCWHEPYMLEKELVNEFKALMTRIEDEKIDQMVESSKV